MMSIKKVVFVALAFLSLQARATPIEFLFEGEVLLPVGSSFSPTDPSAAFSALVTYDSAATNFEPGGSPNFAKYGPVSIFFTVGSETAYLTNARLNIDNLVGSFEGIQWVDDSAAWSGTLFGSAVDTLAINFGRSYNTGLSLDIVTSVDLSEWEYTNGCFILESSNGAETCFVINNVAAVPEPPTVILMLLGLTGIMLIGAGKRSTFC